MNLKFSCPIEQIPYFNHTIILSGSEIPVTSKKFVKSSGHPYNHTGKLHFILFFFFLFTFSFCLEAQATIRYVSKTGTATPPYLTWETASDSIQKCINICEDGDTVLLGIGIFKETLAIDKAILLIGSSRDSSIIDGTNLNGINLFFLTIEILDFVHIKNLTVIGKGPNTSVIIRADYKNILNMDNCYLTHSYHGIQMGFNSSIVKNTIILNFYDDAFTLSGNDSCHLQILNCIIKMADEAYRAIYNDWGGHITITNNIVLMKNPSTSGIMCDGWNSSLNISNNLVYDGFLANIHTRVIADSGKIHNNIVIGKNSDIVYGIDAISDNLSVRNNIIMNNHSGIYIYGPPMDADNNLFWGNDINIEDGTITGLNNIEADPMFVNEIINDSSDYDFHLQMFSPAIDAGDPNILDVDGSRSDIGIFGGPLGQMYTYQDLAPRFPSNLTAVYENGVINLKWNKNTEADLFHYRVYRDTVADFIYDTTKIIGVTADTFFTDNINKTANSYFYKVTAIDSAYNQSPASIEIEVVITGMGEMPPEIVEDYKLMQNYPNPFNPSTRITYRLKDAGYVKIMVYNIIGELVDVLVNSYQDKGYYEIDFNSKPEYMKGTEGRVEFDTGYGDLVSGVYLYRIEVIGKGNIPVYFDMKKMMLVR